MINPYCLLKRRLEKITSSSIGIGANYFVEVYPSKYATFGVKIYTKDGGNIPLDGNALRCARAYLFEHNQCLVKDNPVTVSADAGIYDLGVEVNNCKLENVSVDFKPIFNRNVLLRIPNAKNNHHETCVIEDINGKKFVLIGFGREEGYTADSQERKQRLNGIIHAVTFQTFHDYTNIAKEVSENPLS